MTSISSTNPSRANSLIGSIEITPIDHLEQIISEAKNAQKNWKNHSVRERSQILKLVYTACVNEREKLEKSIAQEMGMPIRQARDEVTLGLTYFLWYIDNAENIFDPEVTRETDTELHVVYYEPRGLIAAVAPWNYPFSMMIWTCIQALLAGNSVIFKTSKECILTGKLIADIFEKANFPK
jgi:acyl-CoA reductase-like NAD-dependent aldehyde dehydrogenase